MDPAAAVLFRERLEDVAPCAELDEDRPPASVRAMVDYLLDEAHDELLEHEKNGHGSVYLAALAVTQASAALQNLRDRLLQLSMILEPLPEVAGGSNDD